MRLARKDIVEKVLSAVATMPIQPAIRIMSGGCGLFSDVFMALNSIDVCCRLGLSGYVDWGRRSLYFDPVFGGNAYTYFFSNARFDFSKHIVLKEIALPYLPSGDTYSGPPHESPRHYLKQRIDAFASPKGDILEEIKAFSRTRLNSDRLLGVHIRRTDVLAGSEERRAQPVSNFVDEAERWLKQNSTGLIFLATDDHDVVTTFQERFGDQVVFQDAIRSKDGKSLHGHFDSGTAASPYRKGREALVDALLLSQCSYLIRCFSFLTCYSLCFNPDLEFLDLDKKNLGVVRTLWLHNMHLKPPSRPEGQNTSSFR